MTAVTRDDAPEATLVAYVDDLLREYPPASTDARVFLRAQYDAGLAWVHYPVGYGGSGASMDLQPIVDDKLAAAGAPASGRVFNAIGADHVLMGSDWPHPEGTPTPASYAACLDGLDDAKIRRVMRDNAMELIAA